MAPSLAVALVAVVFAVFVFSVFAFARHPGASRDPFCFCRCFFF
ncbi:hypothetical protein [Lysobacter tyrosinilyticus]